MLSTLHTSLASSVGLNATDHPLGIACLVVFALSYACVIFEEMLHMKKSKPVMLAAGIIWILVGFIVLSKTKTEIAQNNERKQHNIYHEYSYEELINVCRKKDISEIHNMDKSTLIDLIIKQEE